MSGPLEREFAQVRTSLDTLHYYGAAERHTDDQCPVCGACDEGYDALSSIERHVQEQGELLERLLDYGASGYQEALARRSAWVSSQPAALPARVTEIYGTKADRDGDLRHYAPDARRESAVMGLRDILEAATPGPWHVDYGWDEGPSDGPSPHGWVAPHGAYSDNRATNQLIALAPELAAGNLYAAEAIRAIVLDPEFPGRGPMTITRGQKELLADALARLDQLGKEQR